MSKKEERFEKIYSQGAVNVIEIWVDKETGVNYIYKQSGYSGGMTVLMDSTGKPGKIEKSENVYLYDAGTLHREVRFVNRYDLWRKTYYYALFVYFDENDIVKSTSLKESLEFYIP